MNANLSSSMSIIYKEICDHLEKGILQFWIDNGIDKEYGGFLTSFDQNGKPSGDTDKYIVTQTRMIWGLSSLYLEYPYRKEFLKEAEKGVDFFLGHFWDKKHGGWIWRTTRQGAPKDKAKIVYGESFAIYALSEYTRASGKPVGLEYASKTFDLLEKYCADNLNGGYYENLKEDWTLEEKGFWAGDRKSIDIHMHLMEAFTSLAQCSSAEIHMRRLFEVINLIIAKMIDVDKGCGRNQFDLAFNPIPAININRTWNSERLTQKIEEKSSDSTSYGHNIELVWLLNRALKVLKMPIFSYADLEEKLISHTLQYGFDRTSGGLYREGPHIGPASNTDKEWWQNCEALIGFLDAYQTFEKDEYLYAFIQTWNFAKLHFIDHAIGEWRQLLDKDGNIKIGNIGNPWKAIYHTGRSMLECKKRCESILKHNA